MRFDIVSLNILYRGIGRSLTPDDFFSKKAKAHYDKLISSYFEYLDLMYSATKNNPYNSEIFNDLMGYYKKFKSFGVDCEIIVYDSLPIKNFFGEQIELLGIDVVHELSESLLEDPNSVHDIVKGHLNSFGLCQKLEDTDIVLKNSSCGDIDWKPCWVYKVIV